MSTESQPGETPADEQLTRLLEQALDAPSMQRPFAASLARDLEAAFGQFALSQCADDSAVANGSVLPLRSAAPKDSATSIDDIAGQAPAVRKTSGRLSLRWKWTWVAAASLALVLGLFGTRPSYSWSRMIRAMRSQPWVQANLLEGSRATVVRWVSVVHGVAAERSPDSATLSDQANGVVLRYRNGASSVVQGQLPKESADDALQRQLINLLLGEVDSTGLQSSADVTVVEQSWRHTDDDLIELRATLQINGNHPRTVRVVILLSPKTNLPVSCRILRDPVLRDRDDAASEIHFDYPTKGPRTIYSLGVPAETKVSLESAIEPPMLTADAETPEPEPDGEDTPQPTVEDTAQSDVDEIAQPAVEEAATPADVEPASSDEELAERVDALLAEQWRKLGVTAAEPASDEEFLRRAYLDLVGRIPTAGEARMFLEDRVDGRRTRLVDTLLQSRDHATYLAGVWRRILIPEGVDLAPYGGPQKLEEWLADRFQDNKPYDQIASELLTAEGRVGQSGPMLFYAALRLNPEELASRTSRAFLGLRLECAQCHDHPFDESLSQKDFWGFAAMFARISRPKGKIEVAASVMPVRDNSFGEVTLPDTDTVVPPRLLHVAEPVSDADDAPSRRRQLVKWLTSPENRQFSTATVNRVWAHLFGRGLVEPVDDIRAQNVPVCPEVLEFLAADFARSHFDLRRLLRALVLTQAYQCTSRADVNTDSRLAVFAQMHIKPFTAEQLYDCISVASGVAGPTGGKPGEAALFRLGNASREAFVELFRVPAGREIDYQAGIPQALTMLHGQLIHNATDWSSSGALKSLDAPFFSDEQRVETLFLATLSRMPTQAEREQMIAYVRQAEEKRDGRQRFGDVLWALLNTAEFTLNH